GVITGVVGCGLFLAFAVTLITFAGADSDKRGLSGRHRPESSGATELSGPPFSVAPAVALYRDSDGLGSTTAAGERRSSLRSAPRSPRLAPPSPRVRGKS